jgi:hypothetical protein
MPTIQLVQVVADDPVGAVLTVSEDRARRLVRTGYAVRVADRKPTKRPATEGEGHGRAIADSRV